MSRFRQLSPAYWAGVAALMVGGLLLVLHLVWDGEPGWLLLVASIFLFTSPLFLFRHLWLVSNPQLSRRDKKADDAPSVGDSSSTR